MLLRFEDCHNTIFLCSGKDLDLVDCTKSKCFV